MQQLSGFQGYQSTLLRDLFLHAGLPEGTPASVMEALCATQKLPS